MYATWIAHLKNVKWTLPKLRYAKVTHWRLNLKYFSVLHLFRVRREGITHKSYNEYRIFKSYTLCNQKLHYLIQFDSLYVFNLYVFVHNWKSFTRFTIYKFSFFTFLCTIKRNQKFPYVICIRPHIPRPELIFLHTASSQ